MVEEEQTFPDEMTLRFKKRMDLKGGENSHLKADFLALVDSDGKFRDQCYYAKEHDVGLRVREPGYTNVGDMSASLRAAIGLGEIYAGTDSPHIALSSKHTRLVAIAKGRTQLEALIKTIAGDLNSPFGGFFGFNTPIERETAEFLGNEDIFFEGIVAPDYNKGCVGLLTRPADNTKNRFLIKYGNMDRNMLNTFGCNLQPVVGGLLRQSREPIFDPRKECAVVTGNKGNSDINSLDSRIIDDIGFAGNAAIYISSNLVFFVIDGAIAGLGDGCGARTIAAEKSRLMLERSAYAALSREAQELEGADKLWDRVLYDTPFRRENFLGLRLPRHRLVLLSDAFYPKIDGFIESAGIDRTNPQFQARAVRYSEKEHGVNVEKTFIPKRDNFDSQYDSSLIPEVIVQPGGSLGDKLTIPMAEEYGVKMVFTMTPEVYDKYVRKEKINGRTPTGRRFFGHFPMSPS